jgi:hypothetical protein
MHVHEFKRADANTLANRPDWSGWVCWSGHTETSLGVCGATRVERESVLRSEERETIGSFFVQGFRDGGAVPGAIFALTD